MGSTPIGAGPKRPRPLGLGGGGDMEDGGLMGGGTAVGGIAGAGGGCDGAVVDRGGKVGIVGRLGGGNLEPGAPKPTPPNVSIPITG